MTAPTSGDAPMMPAPGLGTATMILLRWKFHEMRSDIAYTLLIQTFVSVGIIFGLGYLIPDMTAQTAFFIVTGAATLNILEVGLIGVPQQISYEQNAGTFAYMLGFPVPRAAHLLAQVGVRLIEAIPGIVLALVIGALHYDFELTLSFWLIPTAAAVIITGASLGHAIAVVSPSPYLTNILAQAFIFGLFLFSPVLYPSERLPSALASVHAVLPVSYMADTMRDVLGGTTPPARSWAMLGAWTFASLVIAWIAIIRRRWSAVRQA